MADFFVSQLGAGLADGSSPTDPMSLATYNATASGGNTYYVIETLTAKLDPGGAAAGPPLSTRGDYPLLPGGVNVAAGLAFGRTSGNQNNFELIGLSLDSPDAGSCVYLNGSDHAVQNCDITSGGAGIQLGDTANVLDINVTGNRITAVTSGLLWQQSGVNTMGEVSAFNNTFTNAGIRFIAIDVEGGNGFTYLQGNAFIDCVGPGIQINDIATTGSGTSVSGFVIDYNTFTGCEGGLVAYRGDGLVRFNEISGCVGDVDGIFLFEANGIRVHDNYIHDSTPSAARGNGIGMLRCINSQIYNNEFRNLVGAAVDDSGWAVRNQDTFQSLILVYNNFSDGCKHGLAFLNPGAELSINLTAYHNAFINCLGDGMRIGAGVISIPTVRNNSLSGSAGVGIDDQNLVDSDYNNISGWATPYTTGSGGGAGFTNDLTAPVDVDPTTGYTQTSSPGYNMGVDLPGYPGDQNGFALKSPPDIGLQSNLIAPETAAILADREPLDLNQSQTLGLPQLTSVNIVAPDDLLQAQTLDQTSVVEAGTLGVEELTQAQALETPAIVKDIVVSDASQGQALGETLVFPSDTVTVPIDLFQGQALGLAQVAQFGTMSIEPLAQAQTLDEPVMTQASTVSVDALSQAQSIGQPEVFSDTDLGVIESLTQAQSLAESSIEEIANFAPVDLAQGQSLGDVIITQVNFLAAEDISQAQMLGRPVVSDTTLPRLTPPSRRIKVARMDKLVIGA